MISTRFKSMSEIPQEIAEFYFEFPIENGVTTEIVEGTNPETGERYENILTKPAFEMVVIKQPAYYENGGHISDETVKAWDFHDAFINYLDELAAVELYNSTPQFAPDGSEIVFDPMPLPEKPKRDSF